MRIAWWLADWALPRKQSNARPSPPPPNRAFPAVLFVSSALHCLSSYLIKSLRNGVCSFISSIPLSLPSARRRMASPITTSDLDPTYPTFPILASIGLILILLPAYWHFKSRNVGTILYIVWTVGAEGFLGVGGWAELEFPPSSLAT